MNFRTALRQSKQGVWASGLIAVLLWGLYTWLRWWPIALTAVFISLLFLGDAFNIFFIKRNLKNDPDYLKKKIPGT